MRLFLFLGVALSTLAGPIRVGRVRFLGAPAEIGQEAAEPRVMSAANIGIIPSTKSNLHYIPHYKTQLGRTGCAGTQAKQHERIAVGLIEKLLLLGER